MKIRRGWIHLAVLDPRWNVEQPVLVLQTDLLTDEGHPTTWVLPCTAERTGENLLRVRVPAGTEECEAMIDQGRAIDNRRFRRALNPVPPLILRAVEDRLRRLLEL